MKSVSCRPCAFLHRQKAAHLSAVTSGPLHLSVHHHFSWDPNITHDRRADCYSATTCLAIGISVSLWTWMDPQRMPDASRFYLTLPQMASFAPSQPVSGSGPSVPSPSLSTGWLCDHEGTFQRSSVHVVLLLLPPGPVSPLSSSCSQSPLSWKETFVWRGKLQQTGKLPPVGADCNALWLDLFS